MELLSQDFAHFLILNLLAKAWSSRLPCHRLADWYRLRSFHFSKIPHLHLEWISCLMILFMHLIPRFATFHLKYLLTSLMNIFGMCMNCVSVMFLLNQKLTNIWIIYVRLCPVCIRHLLVKIHDNFLGGDHQSFRGRIVTFWHFQAQSHWWYWPVLLRQVLLRCAYF